MVESGRNIPILDNCGFLSGLLQPLYAHFLKECAIGRAAGFLGLQPEADGQKSWEVALDEERAASRFVCYSAGIPVPF
jgi:hypothetical protein